MAPDRGHEDSLQYDGTSSSARMASSPEDSGQPSLPHNETGRNVTYHAAKGQNFTVRGVLVGLVVGILICFSNTFFGLQSGWVSGMTMPASLIGFATFKAFARHLDYPFTPVENVLVQTVAGAVGTMPLGSGFVGVVPALEYLLTPAENGPLKLSLGRLVIWSLGLSFFGVVFGVPLRRQVIIREKLKFPSGTATALMIGVLHGNEETVGVSGDNDLNKSQGNAEVTARRTTRGEEMEEEEEQLLASQAMEQQTERETPQVALGENHKYDGGISLGLNDTFHEDPGQTRLHKERNWRFKIRLLAISFLVSSIYVGVSFAIFDLHILYLSLLTVFVNLPDPHNVFHTTTSSYSISWIIPSLQLVMDI